MIDKLLINKGLGYRNEEEQANRVRPGTVRSCCEWGPPWRDQEKVAGNTRRRPLKMKRWGAGVWGEGTDTGRWGEGSWIPCLGSGCFLAVIVWRWQWPGEFGFSLSWGNGNAEDTGSLSLGRLTGKRRVEKPGLSSAAKAAEIMQVWVICWLGLRVPGAWWKTGLEMASGRGQNQVGMRKPQGLGEMVPAGFSLGRCGLQDDWH